MKPNLKIIKIGGNIIDNPQLLADFLADFSKIEESKILIHGGGILASKLNEKLGYKTIMNNGRRVTDKDNLDTVTMVYAGLINKKIVATLQKNKCNAIGLSGADANTISSKKRPTKPIDYGYVGDINNINTSIIQLFITNNITPVFCAITHNKQGQLLNTNADTIAAEIAVQMSNYYTTELIYIFNKKGVLADINDENSVITKINTKTYSNLKRNKLIHDGMLPKLENCFYALNKNVTRVIIANHTLFSEKINTYTTIIL